jgi:hypothetical protein
MVPKQQVDLITEVLGFLKVSDRLYLLPRYFCLKSIKFKAFIVIIAFPFHILCYEFGLVAQYCLDKHLKLAVDICLDINILGMFQHVIGAQVKILSLRQKLFLKIEHRNFYAAKVPFLSHKNLMGQLKIKQTKILLV